MRFIDIKRKNFHTLAKKFHVTTIMSYMSSHTVLPLPQYGYPASLEMMEYMWHEPWAGRKYVKDLKNTNPGFYLYTSPRTEWLKFSLRAQHPKIFNYLSKIVPDEKALFELYRRIATEDFNGVWAQNFVGEAESVCGAWHEVYPLSCIDLCNSDRIAFQNKISTLMSCVGMPFKLPDANIPEEFQMEAMPNFDPTPFPDLDKDSLELINNFEKSYVLFCMDQKLQDEAETVLSLRSSLKPRP